MIRAVDTHRLTQTLTELLCTGRETNRAQAEQKTQKAPSETRRRFLHIVKEREKRGKTL